MDNTGRHLDVIVASTIPKKGPYMLARPFLISSTFVDLIKVKLLDLLHHTITVSASPFTLIAFPPSPANRVKLCEDHAPRIDIFQTKYYGCLN